MLRPAHEVRDLMQAAAMSERARWEQIAAEQRKAPVAITRPMDRAWRRQPAAPPARRAA